MADDLVKRANLALSDMQGRLDATKLQVFQECVDRIEELEAENKGLRHMILDQINSTGDDPDLVYWTNTTLAELKGEDQG